MTNPSGCKVAVVVPLHKSDITATERFSIERTDSVLFDYDTYFVGPNKLLNFLSELAISVNKNIRIITFDDFYFSGIPGYNRLMMSLTFYQSFIAYDYILIVQPDALILEDKLNDWCSRGYSYVGAPWFCGFCKPTKPFELIGVGNGGFSLRNVYDFIRVLSRFRYMPNTLSRTSASNSNIAVSWLKYIKHEMVFSFNFNPLFPKLSEDIFWGLLAPKYCIFFNVPSPTDASDFSFEVLPELLYELNGKRLPMGCHAWEKYNPDFWKSVFFKIGLEPPH